MNETLTRKTPLSARESGDKSPHSKVVMTLAVSTLLAVFVRSPLESSAAEPESVHLVIATEPGLAIDAPHRWLETLKSIPFATVRIRAGNKTERPDVERRGDGDQVTYHVTGVLRANQVLYVPGASFRRGDQTQLTSWIRSIGEDQQEHASAGKSPFGLDDRELTEFFAALAVPVSESTQDLKATDAVRMASEALDIEVVSESEASSRIRRSSTTLPELTGMSWGTALAVALRPTGVSVVPEKDASGTARVKLVPALAGQKAWPIGWPADIRDRQLVPKLHEKVPVEIANVSLDKTISALQSRIGVPLLIDQNALAAKQLDLSEIKVRFPRRETDYKRVLDRVLFQAGLEAELRTDELRQPFLWITTFSIR